MKPKIIAIVGPTASGKSDLATKIALEFQGEIINADSRQIYKGLDLLTNKPDATHHKQVTHHLFSLLDPQKDFNVAEYQKLAKEIIDDILKRKKVPILVGGTGLYLDSVTSGLVFAAKPDPELRAGLNDMGLSQLLLTLKQVAPDVVVDTKNRVRVIRAIEISKSGHKPTKSEPPYDVLKVGVGLTKEELSERIQNRIQNLDIKTLSKEIQGYPVESRAGTALGVAEILAFIQGQLTEKALKEKLITLHKQYAKRQMTWFKKDSSIKWVSPKTALTLVRDFLQST